MIGTLVSHYRIVAELGAGGMGVVYRADDLTLRREVALKFLPPELARDPAARARFAQEANAAAALNHPNVCTIHEVGETDDGRAFIAMAFYEGETLRDRLARGPLPVDAALDLAVQVARGLAEAHRRGVVHRDLKPANVMLTADGRAVVMDFGLARVAGATRLTRTGTLSGTPAYLPPEVVQGGEADEMGDVWAAGALLYEMLAGAPPFMAAHEQAVLYRIVHEEPAPLASRRSDAPAALLGIVGAALSKDRAARPAGMAALLAALEACRTGGVPARPRPVRRRPGRRALVAAAVALALAGGAWALLRLGGNRLPGTSVALAVMDFEGLGAGRDSLSAPGLTSLVQVGLVENCPVRVVSPEYLHDLRRRLFGESAGRITADQALAVTRKAGATLMLAGQVGRSATGPFATWRLVDVGSGRDVAARRVSASELIPLADGILAAVVPLVAESAGQPAAATLPSVAAVTTGSDEAYRHYVAGLQAWDKGDDGLGAAEFERAIAADSTFAMAYWGLASVQLLRNEDRQGRQLMEEAWRLRARLGMRERMLVEARRAELNGHWNEALGTYREMMARWPDDGEIPRRFVQDAFYIYHPAEAAEVARGMLARYPDDGWAGSILVLCLTEAGRVDEAVAAARDLVARFPREPDPWQLLARAFGRAGQPDSCAAALEQARRRGLDDLSHQKGLVDVAVHRGDTEAAIALLDGLIARPGLTPAERAILARQEEPNLVDLYGSLGRIDAARDVLRRTQPRAAPTPVDHLFMGMLALRWGDHVGSLAHADAIAGLARAADHPPYPGWLLRGLALAAMPDSAAAARGVLRRLLQQPDRPGLYDVAAPLWIEAEVLRAEGRPDSAAAVLGRYASLYPLLDERV